VPSVGLGEKVSTPVGQINECEPRGKGWRLLAELTFRYVFRRNYRPYDRWRQLLLIDGICKLDHRQSISDLGFKRSTSQLASLRSLMNF
jgi:hypothetical protein